MNDYTGRKIAIMTDIHSLLEPTKAVLDDISRRNITEIYSLGDNIGTGPNPFEVLNLLSEYGVKTVNGNSEEYAILGLAPFGYMFGTKAANAQWTSQQITPEQLEKMKNNVHSYDLNVGGKIVGLCHFANDVRYDFNNSTWSYQSRIRNGDDNPQRQFYYTNSDADKEKVQDVLEKCDSSKILGFASAKNDPLFKGKTVKFYDEIMQGHVHFKYLTQDENVIVRTVRAVGMAYGDDPNDCASYIIIKEKNFGYDVEEILIPYDREKMLRSIDESNLPSKNEINKYVSRM